MDDDEPSVPFEGLVRRSHPIEPGNTVLVLDRYAGDIEVGARLRVVHGGATSSAKVVTVAWGSSFGHEAVPLTLVVSGLASDTSFAGATLHADA
jgi:hypothetical protein